MNWNILVTSGKEIKRDSMISVNESRTAYINVIICIQYYNTIHQYINKVKRVKLVWI